MLDLEFWHGKSIYAGFDTVTAVLRAYFSQRRPIKCSVDSSSPLTL